MIAIPQRMMEPAQVSTRCGSWDPWTLELVSLTQIRKLLAVTERDTREVAAAPAAPIAGSGL